MARSSKWYHNQRNVAFIVITVFVVLLVGVIGFFGSNTDLATTLFKPVSRPVIKPIGGVQPQGHCTITGQDLMAAHYNGTFFTGANSQDGTVTFKNKTNCTGQALISIRVAAGGPIINNQHARMWQQVEVAIPPNSTITRTVSVPQGCNFAKTVQAGAQTEPVTSDLDFRKPVIFNVDVNNGGICPAAVSPFIGHIGSAMPVKNSDEEADILDVRGFGIGPDAASAQKNAISGASTACNLSSTSDLFPSFKVSFMEQTGVDPTNIVSKWLNSPPGKPFPGICEPGYACIVDPGSPPSITSTTPLGTITPPGNPPRPIPIFGAIAEVECAITAIQ